MPDQVVTSIPTSVDVSYEEDDDIKNPSELKFGAATPGTMATTSSSMDLASPFGIFAAFAASSQRALFVDTTTAIDAYTEEKTAHDEDEDENEPMRCLGITSPDYHLEDDDESVDSTRIGIERSDYVIPDGEIPISPIDKFFIKKSSRKVNTAAKEYDSDDGEDLWQLNLRKPEEPFMYEIHSPESRLDTVPEDDVERVLHKQTAEGHYLVNSRPLDKPIDNIKYSLDKGKKGMDRMMRMASDTRLMKPKTRPNVVRTNSSHGLSLVTDGASFKIFVLLVQPKSKIFEIIQVFYAPSQTRVGDILELIPANATEPALGMQTYISICRPKDGRPIDLEMMASSSSTDGDGCARIIRGEILVAIPEGYSGPFIAKIAKPLLSNPKVTRLLDRSDPLAPTLKKKKKKRHSSSLNYKSISVEPERPLLYEVNSDCDKAERVADKEQGLLRKALDGTDEFGNVINNNLLSPSAVNNFAARDMWHTNMSFRSDSSSCSSIGSNNSMEIFSSPTPTFGRRSSNGHWSGHELHMSIPEHPTEAIETGIDNGDHQQQLPPLQQLSDDASPSSATVATTSNIELATLEAKLQSKDVNGAIDAFSKMLSGLGGDGNDAVVMQQLYAAIQQQQNLKQQQSHANSTAE